MGKIRNCKKIIVVGNAGSGKTHFSIQLAEILGLPLIHLDKEYWNENWTETPRENWLNKHRELISGDSWIIDGHYSSLLKPRFKEADGVIFLDIANTACYKNLLERRIKFANTPRPDLPPNCPEFLRKDQWRKIRFYRTERNRLHTYMQRYPKEFVFTLYNRNEEKKFLDELRAGKEPTKNY